jgi:hypothetical protein
MPHANAPLGGLGGLPPIKQWAGGWDRILWRFEPLRRSLDVMFKFLFGVAFGAAGYWAWQSFGRDLLGLGGDQDTYGGYSGSTSFGSSASSGSFGASGATGGSSPSQGAYGNPSGSPSTASSTSGDSPTSGTPT